jgi:GH24 family phage-related lysozyme (muramidase)
VTTTAEFIAGFEGYAGRAYWDVNAWRLGYGSDTEGPDQIHVTEGMETTKPRALQNLALRIPQFQTEAVYGRTGMGRDTWDKLTEHQQAAITSLVYNYGRLPIVITPSDPAKTAAAIRALQNANGGVNRHRRLAEASFYLTPDAGAPMPAPAAPPAPAPQVQVPPAPMLVPMPQLAPAGAPSISPSAAGRITAVLDGLMALREGYLADRASLDAEIAVLDTTIADFGKLQGAAPSPIPPLLQKPAAGPAVSTTPQPQGISTMQKLLGTNWITSLFGSGSIAGAIVTLGIDVYNKQMPDAATMTTIGGLFSAGIGLLNSKDSNVTGGTIPQTVEAQARATSAPITK